MKQSGFGIASLVLGIVSILLACVGVGIFPAILGIIFAIIGLISKSKKSGTAIAGLICSIVGVIFFLFAYLVADSFLDTYNKEKQKKVETVEQSETETNDAEVDEKAEEQTEQEEELQTYNVGDSVVLKDWEIIVTDFKIVDSISENYGKFSPDEEGNKYAQVFVSVTNNGKQTDRFLPSYGYGDDVNAKLLYGDGYEFSATNLLGYSNEMHDSTINPLSSKTGEIVFNISEVVANSEDEILLQFNSGNDTIQFKVR